MTLLYAKPSRGFRIAAIALLSFLTMLPAARAQDAQLSPAQLEQIKRKKQRRDQIKQEIKKLSESRNDYIKEKVEADGGAEDSLDEKIYRAVKNQAAGVGLSYDSDSAKY